MPTAISLLITTIELAISTNLYYEYADYATNYIVGRRAAY